MCIQKLEFVNLIVATIASGQLGEIANVRLGSAVIVNVDKYNRFNVANVCNEYRGYFSNDVTDYDRAQLGN